jgi:hypothetical protein
VTNSAADDNSIIQTITGSSNTTTVNVGDTAASGDADIDLVVTGDSNTVTINENSTATMLQVQTRKLPTSQQLVEVIQLLLRILVLLTKTQSLHHTGFI